MVLWAFHSHISDAFNESVDLCISIPLNKMLVSEKIHNLPRTLPGRYMKSLHTFHVVEWFWLYNKSVESFKFAIRDRWKQNTVFLNESIKCLYEKLSKFRVLWFIFSESVGNSIIYKAID